MQQQALQTHPPVPDASPGPLPPKLQDQYPSSATTQSPRQTVTQGWTQPSMERANGPVNALLCCRVIYTNTAPTGCSLPPLCLVINVCLWERVGKKWSPGQATSASGPRRLGLLVAASDSKHSIIMHSAPLKNEGLGYQKV